MKTLKHLLISLTLLSTLVTFGQTPVQKPCDLPYIEITGTAEREVIPDEIYIGISLKEKYNNREKITIEVQEEKLKQLVKSLDIDVTNLSVSRADADYVKVSWNKKDVITKKYYTLKVSDAFTVSRVFQGLEDLDVPDANISKVNYSKMDSLRKEVRILAIIAAKEKAEYMLSALGEKLGKPLIISENVFLPTSNVIGIRGQRSDGNVSYLNGIKVENENQNEIAFEKIKIQISVDIKFQIL